MPLGGLRLTKGSTGPTASGERFSLISEALELIWILYGYANVVYAAPSSICLISMLSVKLHRDPVSFVLQVYLHAVPGAEVLASASNKVVNFITILLISIKIP